MAGSSELAIPGHWSMRETCGFIFFLLTLIQTVTGNQGSIVGSCPCDLKLLDSPNPTQWRSLITNLQGYESCHNYIRFRLPRITLCASSEKTWVQKLRICFDNQECGHAKTYKSGNQGRQDDYPITTIQGSTGLDQSPPFTTMDPFSQTNQSTRTQSGGVRDKHLNDTTSAPLENSSIENPKWEAEKGQTVRLNTSTNIAILCLLGIVFVLTGVLAYVLCRNRRAVESPKQHPEGFELISLCEGSDLPDVNHASAIWKEEGFSPKTVTFASPIKSKDLV